MEKVKTVVENPYKKFRLKLKLVMKKLIKINILQNS